MKKLFTLFLFCAAMTAQAASSSIITLTVTVTNNPVGHDTFVFNGNTRTWTNAVSGSPTTLISLGANIGASTTNLFRHIAGTPYSGPVSLGAISSSNVFTLRGALNQAVTATAGTWATLSYSTQTVTTMYDVRVPASGEPTPSRATNIQSQLANDLSNYSTNAFATNTSLVSNLVQTDGAQSIYGNKTFRYQTFFGSSVSISNAYPNVALYFYDVAGAADNKWTRLSQGNNLWTIETLTDAGAPTTVFTINPVNSLVSFGGGIEASILYGSELTNGIVQNSALGNTNTVAGNWRWSRANHTALANGNNAGVDFGTNIFTKIKAGPSAAFAICGIVGGADGRELKIYNSVAQNMTIANDSGVEPVAANRIYTGTGGDIATTGIGFVHLIYDSEDSRWVVMNYQP